MTPLSLEELEQAAQLVYGVMTPTPQYEWPKLSRRAGCSVRVKHENHTPTGAFKVRGGIVYLDHLMRSQPDVTSVISATRGNHGQSIAFAAARKGIAATIVVPKRNSPDQNTAIAAFGATVVEHGDDFDAARHEANRLAAAYGSHFVPSFHRNLIAGVASYALELFKAAPAPDVVYVGVGMGSGICGLMAARDALCLRTEIIGVGALEAPATARSFAAGSVTTAPTAHTFADGLATREPDAAAIAMICNGVSRWVEVSEDAIAAAMRVYYDDAHQIAEGAGAAPLAALLHDCERLKGKNVAVILSGGNIERSRFRQVLNGDTPRINH